MQPALTDHDLYGFLGVHPGASAEEIRLEKRMRRNFNIDQQIARYPPAPTAPTMTRDTQVTAGWDPRRNSEAEMPSFPGNGAIACASRTFR